MADRITVTTGGVAGSSASGGPRAARFIAAGQTQFGPTDAPRVVRNMRDYVNTFGARSGGANLYDAAEVFFNAGGAEMVVQRAFGPSAVNATISLDTNKIVVTARAPGAYYNAWTVAYTSASLSKTITIVKGARTVTYTGTDAASLQAAASVDPDVTVTVSSLPASNVSATALASGADDFANVVWATVLGRIGAAAGPGAVAVPGVNGAASAVAAHAAAFRRFGLLTPVQTDSAATVISSQGSITAANQQWASYVLNWGTVPDGAGGLKVVDGCGYAAGVRAVVMRTYGVGESPLRRAAHALAAPAQFRPLVEVDDATHTSLLAAGVVTIRTLPTGVGPDVWAVAAGVGGNAKLQEGVFRDLVNAVTDEAARALDQFVGRPATGSVLTEAESVLKGICERYRPWLTDRGNADPGYRVAVSAGTDVADNRITAVISLRFSEQIGFVDFTVNAASADQTI